MLYQLMELIKQHNSSLESKSPPIKCVFISGDELSGWADGEGLEINRATFFSFISYMIFEETMSEAKLKRRLHTDHTRIGGDELCERSGRLCLLVDEMQDLMGFDDIGMQKGVEEFFRFLWNRSISVIGAGTFERYRWNWADTLRPMPSTQLRNPLRSPYNKPFFRQWPSFSFDEVNRILEIYEKRIGRMHDGLWSLIHQEANGHAASIMALLRFVREERPRLDNWNVLLEAKVASHMNGFRNSDTRSRQRSINGKMCAMHYGVYWCIGIARGGSIWTGYLMLKVAFSISELLCGLGHPLSASLAV